MRTVAIPQVSFAALLAVVAFAGPAHASSTVYLDRSAWEAAVSGSLYTETFDAVPDQSIPMFVGGVMYTPGFDIVIPAGVVLETSIQGGVFRGDAEEDSEVPFLGYNDIVFHAPVTAIGFDVKRIDGNSTISATFNGERLHLASGLPGPVPVSFFFGVVFDTPLSNVRINGNHRFYSLDGLSFSSVPEPAELGALAALGALLAIGRRARTV